MRPKKFTAELFIKAIRGGYEAEDENGATRRLGSSAGIISTIANRVGCNWHTADKWIHENAEVREAYNDEIEKNLDMAESVILRSIQGGDTNDAKWYLSKKGKLRGYDDVQDARLSGEVILVVKRETTKMPEGEVVSTDGQYSKTRKVEHKPKVRKVVHKGSGR